MIDLQAVRADCPSCENILHFNNAGCALSPRQVTDAVIEHLQLEQEIGGYEAADAAAGKISGFYTSLARLLNCQADEIAYLENATKAWHAAFHAIELEPGDHVITADMEYASNYLDLLHFAKRFQIEISVIPSDQQGYIDLEKLRHAINPKTKLITLTHVASQRGDIQPAAEVGRIAREHGLWYLLDACQSAGQVVLDVEALNCDFLCGTGRKYLRGPRGTGFLYARKSRMHDCRPAVVDLHSVQWQSISDYQYRPDASRFENWERNYAATIGLARAVDYALELGMEAIQQRVQSLAGKLHEKLGEQADITVHECSPTLSGIVTFNKRDEAAKALQERLSAQGINTSVASYGNARLDLGAKLGKDLNRASLHYYNNEEEIDRFVAIVAED